MHEPSEVKEEDKVSDEGRHRSRQRRRQRSRHRSRRSLTNQILQNQNPSATSADKSQFSRRGDASCENKHQRKNKELKEENKRRHELEQIRNDVLKKCKVVEEIETKKPHIILPKEIIPKNIKKEIEHQHQEAERRKRDHERQMRMEEAKETKLKKKEKKAEKRKIVALAKENLIVEKGYPDFINKNHSLSTSLTTSSSDMSANSPCSYHGEPEEKPSLLEKHLQAFHELIKVQPRRHTTQQLELERQRMQEAIARRQQEELQKFRSKCASQLSNKSEVATNDKKALLEKLRQKELQRNEEESELQNIVKRSKTNVEKDSPGRSNLTKCVLDMWRTGLSAQRVKSQTRGRGRCHPNNEVASSEAKQKFETSCIKTGNSYDTGMTPTNHFSWNKQPAVGSGPSVKDVPSQSGFTPPWLKDRCPVQEHYTFKQSKGIEIDSFPNPLDSSMPFTSQPRQRCSTPVSGSNRHESFFQSPMSLLDLPTQPTQQCITPNLNKEIVMPVPKPLLPLTNVSLPNSHWPKLESKKPSEDAPRDKVTFKKPASYSSILKAESNSLKPTSDDIPKNAKVNSFKFRRQVGEALRARLATCSQEKASSGGKDSELCASTAVSDAFCGNLNKTPTHNKPSSTEAEKSKVMETSLQPDKTLGKRLGTVEAGTDSIVPQIIHTKGHTSIEFDSARADSPSFSDQDKFEPASSMDEWIKRRKGSISSSKSGKTSHSPSSSNTSFLSSNNSFESSFTKSKRQDIAHDKFETVLVEGAPASNPKDVPETCHQEEHIQKDVNVKKPSLSHTESISATEIGAEAMEKCKLQSLPTNIAPPSSLDSLQNSGFSPQLTCTPLTDSQRSSHTLQGFQFPNNFTPNFAFPAGVHPSSDIHKMALCMQQQIMMLSANLQMLLSSSAVESQPHVLSQNGDNQSHVSLNPACLQAQPKTDNRCIANSSGLNLHNSKLGEKNTAEGNRFSAVGENRSLSAQGSRCLDVKSNMSFRARGSRSNVVRDNTSETTSRIGSHGVNLTSRKMPASASKLCKGELSDIEVNKILSKLSSLSVEEEVDSYCTGDENWDEGVNLFSQKLPIVHKKRSILRPKFLLNGSHQEVPVSSTTPASASVNISHSKSAIETEAPLNIVNNVVQFTGRKSAVRHEIDELGDFGRPLRKPRTRPVHFQTLGPV